LKENPDLADVTQLLLLTAIVVVVEGGVSKAGVTTLKICIILVRLQVIIGVSVKITVFWVVKPYCLAEAHQRFGGTS
jgi:hypothetical protein